jgi:Ribosomal protein L35
MVDACLALADYEAADSVDYIINPFRDHDRTTMSAFAFFSTARQFIASSPRLFSSSATLGYPKLKTHSGTKKRWRALASGVLKRVSTVQSDQSAE